MDQPSSNMCMSEINIRAISQANQRIYASNLRIQNPNEFQLFSKDHNLDTRCSRIKLKEAVHTIELCKNQILKLHPTSYEIYYRSMGLEKVRDDIVYLCKGLSTSFISLNDKTLGISLKFSIFKPNILKIDYKSSELNSLLLDLNDKQLIVKFIENDITILCNDILVYKFLPKTIFLFPYFLIFFACISKISSCSIVYDESFNSRKSSIELFKKSILSHYLSCKQDETFYQFFHGMLSQSVQYGMKCIPSSSDRYHDIVPYSGKRIVLNSENSLESDYINASPIEIEFPEPYGILYVISTQGPLTSTVADFWNMVLQQSTNLIIMLTDLEERNGKEKCCLYWPTSDNPIMNIGKDVSIIFVKEQQMLDGIVYRKFKWNCSDKDEYIEQYQLTKWIDHGTVQLNRLITLLSIIEYNSRMTVHCSAGIGRSGTFIIAFILYHIFKTRKLPIPSNCIYGDDIIPFLIEKLREQRVGMVQTDTQLEMLYQLIEQVGT